MKKYIVYLLVIGCCITFFGCQDLEEDAKGSLVADTFFSTEGDLDAAVVAAFKPLISGWSGFNAAQSYVPVMGGDDVTTHPKSNKLPFRQFDLHNVSSDNEPMRWTWSQLYQSILACNSVEDNYEKVSTTEEKKNEALAQVCFVRALSYFHLVQIWGDIPMPLTAEIDLLIEKTPIQQVYDQIYEDLEFAEQILPVTWSEEPGRPTKGAAKALLAKVYLTNAGWPLKDAAMYAKAAAKAKEVMDLNQYALLPNYADLWKLANGNNEESIFSFQHSKTTGTTFWFTGIASMPEAEEGGWDDVFSEIQFFYDFPAGPRKDATFYTVFKKKVDGEIVEVPWQESVQNNPYYQKFRDGAVDEENPWSAQMGTDFKMPYIRYADLLLMYAEATCMSSGPDEFAYRAINDVRNRAGLADLTENLSQTAFRDSVIAERGWELACERHRWFDLVRTEKVEEIALKRHPEDIPFFDLPTKDDYLAPIPQREVDKNPNLK
ncbi:MAG: RagB/SusD family nutrient uptake outer membrane protein [Marinilabiliaceae bacterium]|nr:RagB/SusD family nutrient uptake outer membrane protein [Marinilabiliaceae bacterium]